MAQSSRTLDFWFIDVEGGQATLVRAPSGQALLIDTGWPGARDADRIAAAAKRAGIQKIDDLLITHYHIDHAGGVPDLARRIPIGTFIDHGESVERDENGNKLFRAYSDERQKGKHRVAEPGETIDLGAVKLTFLTAAGRQIAHAVAGGGETNSLCGSEPRRDTDPSENAQSVGTLLTFGNFRAVDLGDLTWNKEMDLVCPKNLAGRVDLYIASHHGINLSGSATLVHALAPRVAIMDNGARKGGSPEAYRAMKSSPGIEDIWQVHTAVASGAADNAPEKFVANTSESADEGFALHVAAHEDGSFEVTNERNSFSKRYGAKAR